MNSQNQTLEAVFCRAKSELTKMDHGRLNVTLEVHNHSITLVRFNVGQDFKPSDLPEVDFVEQDFDSTTEPLKCRRSVKSYNKGGAAVEITAKNHG